MSEVVHAFDSTPISQLAPSAGSPAREVAKVRLVVRMARCLSARARD